MSMMFCSYCGDLADTDDGECHWDVKKLSSPKVYEMVCGICAEKYLTEEDHYTGEIYLDPDLEEKLAMQDKGDAMAAQAEDETCQPK